MTRVSLLIVALLSLTATPKLDAAVPPTYDDAPLRAVQFVDRNEGWAVGDHGTVWHSIDAGKTWERQRTGSRASLRAVQFLTPYFGWAVGRIELPRGAGSQGVVLATTDGGATWRELTSSTLPGLNAVRFFDEKRGIVAGDGTDAFPSGLFSTVDGGATWTPLPGPRATTWMAAEFPSPNVGIVAGAWGKLMRVREGKLLGAELDPVAGRAIRGVAMDGQRAIAVADGGRILVSPDAGVKWGFANLPLPASTVNACDFHCVAAAGNHVWVAGRPGSVILHSPDFGRTWDVQTTNVPVPIHGIAMLDEQTGWAVGALGTILGTTDGGKTWTVRQCGGQRAAMLFAHATPGAVPLGTIAAMGGAEGYFAVGLAVTSPDLATADPARACDEFRLGAAVRAVGGAEGEGTWGFPVPSHLGESGGEDLVNRWGGKDRLIRQMVLALRIWRPEVVVTDLFPSTNPGQQAVLAAIQEAFKLAGDATAFPEQLSSLGLAVHAPRKLYSLSADTPDAPVKLDLTRFSGAIQDTPRDAAEPAAGLVPDATSPDRQAFRLLSHRMKGAELHTGLMDGVDLAEGGAARRTKPQANPALAVLLVDREKAARTRLQLEAIARNPEAGGGAEKALAHVAGIVATMPDDMAARAAVGIGNQLAAEGKWTAAREMFSLVAVRYSAHPEAADALRWLARYYASTEARRRIELGHQAVFQKAAFVPAGAGGTTPASHVEPAVLARQMYQFSSPEAAQQWNRACLDLEPNLAAFGTGYARDPATQLSLQAARRNLGLYGDASQAVTNLLRGSGGLVDYTPGTDPWRDCLAAELWLGNPAAVPVRPKPLGRITYSSVKPMLDGKLDDACWKSAQPFKFDDRAGTTGKAYPTRAHLAFDEKFLYLAVACGHPEGQQVPKAAKRIYDDDLAGRDRVELMLDLDRDYQTYYRLRIDQRGCVADDCWGDAKWNPRWFVALEPTATGWTAEIAIPIAELTGTPPAHGQVWAGNIMRVLPGRGVQSWSGPADATPRPEGMGLFQFHAEAK